MKIEKINDNQLRFTLTREDLATHHIKLSELSYGSDKARSLFMEMMQKAAREYGFVVNNTPLMVEAIPISADSIILIVTKVENPDELDSRFARYSKEDASSKDAAAQPTVASVGADDVLDLIAKLSQLRKAAKDAKQEPTAGEARAHTQGNPGAGVPSKDAAASTQDGKAASEDAAASQEAQDAVYRLTRFYLFQDLPTLIRAAHVLDPAYDAPGSLFKNPDDGHYYLLIKKADTDPALFNKVCNVISEYAMPVDYTEGMEQFFEEHMETLLGGNAIQSLRQL